ncbi:MAG TPA: nickel pincer cofactor biosynthesis protein LarB [Aggregatilinea sp.]|uniref:nickel pincer cofactor biosynthesis protein LarB n=1 Tax=Aggregatilinea sp. TaxID=2806333 RepID=UPI002C184255|nr:nickel pincer cofactor biosynthesis protein LarB [Aggregatilinea sp.]HML20358.1 nickel pincer cofactor biosynthesis protein LarB [Aggregatilinea sp.]
MSDSHLPYDQLGEYARLDTQRMARQGIPEFVYAESKTPEQVAAIMKKMADRLGYALASRATAAHAGAVQTLLPEAQYDPTSRLLTVGALPVQSTGLALVVAAGTSDLPVAEEACGVLSFLGDPVQQLYDVGVAGIHRLFAHLNTLSRADVLIVVAGMEGALPTLVGGLVAAPVIAVPTSVGYGASFGGLAALLSMLNSCAAGITVVNIDNGLGAATAAHRILLGMRQAPTNHPDAKGS